MQFSITIIDDIACITIEGTLNALDMIFMIQGPEYKNAISQHRKLLIDYSHIDSSTLTPEDAMGITMLGKRQVEQFGETHIAIVVDDTERADREKMSHAIFSASHSKIDVTDNKKDALQILRKGF